MSTIASHEADQPVDAAEICILHSHAGFVFAPPMGHVLARIAAKVALLVREHARFATLISACALYLLPFMRVMLQRTDEGTFLSGAERLVHGQVFARDFVEVMGPGMFYWLALFYKAFGVNAFATRACLFLSWMATAVLVYRLSRYITPQYRLLPLALIVATGFYSLVGGIGHHMESNCLSLLAVSCLSEWHSRRKARWLVFAGTFTAFTALVYQPKGLLLWVAASGWVWMLEYKSHNAGRAFRWMAGGFFTIIGMSVAYFAEQGALADLFRATCVWPFQHYSAVNRVPYGWSTFTYGWHGVPLSTPGTYGIFLLACVLIVPFLFVFVLPGLLTLQVCRRNLRSIPADLWLYLICGASLWISELHRQDIVHLVFGSPLLIIASVQLLRPNVRPLSRLIPIVLICSACTLALCNLITVLHVHTVSTRAGKIATLDGGDEFGALTARLAPGEEIFVYPYSPSYYFLTGTENPTRFSILVSGYNTPAEVREVIRTLESRGVNHVLWDTKSRKNLSVYSPAALYLPDDLAPLETYLRARYTTVFDQNGFQILERKREPIVQ